MKERKSIVLLYEEGKVDLFQRAVKEYLDKEYTDADVAAVSDGEMKRFRTWTRRTVYKLAVRSFSGVYGSFNKLKYKLVKPSKNKAPRPSRTHKDDDGKEPKRLFTTRKMRNVIKRFRPDVIVAASPKLFKSALRARLELGHVDKIKVACGIFEFVPDKRLLLPGADMYLAANTEVQRYALENGIKPELVSVTGFPMPAESLRDYEDSDPQGIAARLGFKQDLPVITVCGGRYGSSAVKRLLKYLAPFYDTYNIVCFFGGNKSLLRAADKTRKVLVPDDDVDFREVLSVSEFVATTPTAGTLYETLFRLVPVILGRPTGYIESETAEYLIKNKYALNGFDEISFRTSAERVLKDKLFKSNLIENTVRFTDANGARRAGDILYGMASVKCVED